MPTKAEDLFWELNLRGEDAAKQFQLGILETIDKGFKEPLQKEVREYCKECWKNSLDSEFLNGFSFTKKFKDKIEELVETRQELYDQLIEEVGSEEPSFEDLTKLILRLYDSGLIDSSEFTKLNDKIDQSKAQFKNVTTDFEKRLESAIVNDIKHLKRYVKLAHTQIGIESLVSYIQSRPDVELTIEAPLYGDTKNRVIRQKFEAQTKGKRTVQIRVTLDKKYPDFTMEVSAGPLNRKTMKDPKKMFCMIKKQSETWVKDAIARDDLNCFKVLFRDPAQDEYQKKQDKYKKTEFAHHLHALSFVCQNWFVEERRSLLIKAVETHVEHCKSISTSTPSPIDGRYLTFHLPLIADKNSEKKIDLEIEQFLMKHKKVVTLPYEENFNLVDISNIWEEDQKDGKEGDNEEGESIVDEPPQNPAPAEQKKKVDLKIFINIIRAALKLTRPKEYTSEACIWDEELSKQHDFLVKLSKEKLLRDPQTFQREADEEIKRLNKLWNTNGKLRNFHEVQIHGRKCSMPSELTKAIDQVKKVLPLVERPLEFKDFPPKCKQFLYESGYIGIDKVFDPDGSKDTLLHLAFRHGAVDIISFLIDKKANSLKLNKDGDCPIAIGIRSGKQKVRVKALNLLKNVNWEFQRPVELDWFNKLKTELDKSIVKELKVYAEYLRKLDDEVSYFNIFQMIINKFWGLLGTANTRKHYSKLVNMLAEFLDSKNPLKLKADLESVVHPKELKKTPKSIKKLLKKDVHSFTEIHLSSKQMVEYHTHLHKKIRREVQEQYVEREMESARLVKAINATSLMRQEEIHRLVELGLGEAKSAPS